MVNVLRQSARSHARFAWFSLALLLSWVSGRTVAGMQAGGVLTIDPAGSRVLIEVGKTGAFSFAGHVHQVLAPAVGGRVMFEPTDWVHSAVSLKFDASALKVTGKGDPPADIPKVQQVMLGDEVLDV